MQLEEHLYWAFDINLKTKKLRRHNIDFAELKNELEGDFLNDLYAKSIYATDASNYQIVPLAIVVPKNKKDIQTTLAFCRKNGIPITSRGGGTSLVGQTIGEGIILDFTKYMNAVLEVNVKEKFAWVEPGIVRDELNASLEIHRLHFAPDPATTSRATVGGMIANNSSGTRSILYGKTLDHVLELEILLVSGETIYCENVNLAQLEKKCELQTKEGEIYRKLIQIISVHEEEINARFPKVMRRVGGYNLDEFLSDEINLSKLIIGSESSLAIITRAKIKLEPLPNEQALCVVHFDDFFEGLDQVSTMVAHQPASVELLDDMLIRLSRENLDTQRYCHFIEGNPGSVLLVEFFGNVRGEALRKANALQQLLKEKNVGYACPVFTEKKDLDAIFTVRKKGLGLLLGVKGKRKPIAIIEDAAVPLENLSAYIKEVFSICKRHQTPVVAYAHASVGLLHVKPLLDLRDHEDIEKMKLIATETVELVKKYKGSWSGEHGDGLARSPYNKEFFGEKIYNAFIEVKSLFDPQHLLNPGKIVNAPAVDSNLRYGSNYIDNRFTSMFHYRREGGFHDAVHLCNGVGECRKTTGGSMCPSFRATKDEKDTTRARANILRLAMSGQIGGNGFLDKSIDEAMDLCLSCKACKTECPSNVDMSKLKSEMLHLRNKEIGISIKTKLIANQRWIAQIASYFPFSNHIVKSKFFRKSVEKIASIDSRRILPLYDSRFLKSIPSLNRNAKKDGKKVLLFADTYMLYHEYSLGIKAYRLLTMLGYEVEIYAQQCCQRPAISKGLLEQAKSKGKVLLEDLKKYCDQKIPILVIEPSCATALLDDLPDLMDSTDFNPKGNIFLLEDFLIQEKIQEIPIQKGHYLFHGHCHHKAIFSTSSIHKLFANAEFSEMESGCCGMAGSFGYDKDHYDLSKKIGELSVLSKVKIASGDTTILTSGFSCKHQIADFTNKKPLHWLEVIEV